MDNELGTNDPYREMETGEKNIRPGFLGGNGEKAAGVLSAAEDAASAVMAAKGGKVPTKGGATGGVGGGEAKGVGGVGGIGGTGGTGGAKNAVKEGLKSDAEKSDSGAKKEDQNGLYNKNKKDQSENNEPTLKMSKGMKTGLKVAAPFLILLVGVVVIIALIVALPMLMIGALDYNLMKVLGFENTVAILEKVAEFVTGEYMKDGVFPSEYASDLAAHGVDVGQVLANGDFVKTNTYIADIDTRNDLVAAAGGFSYISDDEGELAMLYDGKIIRADDFVAAVESDPVLYAAYSASADISTKYYYGDDVEEVYKEMELSRGNFNDWKTTGNYKQDEEKFASILEKTLDSGSKDQQVSGYYNDKKLTSIPEGMTEDDADIALGEGDGTYSQPISGQNADEITSNVSEKTKEYVEKWEVQTKEVKGVPVKYLAPTYSQNATKRAAELLNTSISSGEPYLAANAFIAIEEPIQRARVDGDGPVNEVMNTLTKRTSATYQNVETGANETKNLSILETKNFRAVVSDSKYSKEEAQNFGRDRVLKTTGQADEEIIQSTNVTMKDKSEIRSVVRNGKDGDSADDEIIAKATENISLAQANKNSETFKSVVGGNRIVEGGSFLSNTINMKVIGAMPSDNGKITAYHQEVEEAMARRAEAERATKNPFDITSPNTFLGSIVHNMATTILGNYSANMTALSVITAAGNTAGSAVANLTGTVNAAGSKEFTTTYGAGCETVGTVKVEGDLYCTSHNTPSTKYINYTLSDFKGSEIGGDIGDDGSINEGSGLWEFVHFGMDRYATVGVRSAEVCERYREVYDSGLWDKIVNLFQDIGGTYDACVKKGDDKLQKVATGARYTFGEEGEGPNELYSSYVMYDEVNSLLSGKKSAVAKSREDYRAKHPLDNSRAGVVARRSGMTKHEAEIALAYSDYLTMIANYNPATRFDFTAPVVLMEKPILEKQSDDVSLNLYAWYSKETEYSDLRTRNFVV